MLELATIKVEQRDHGALVTFNRPHALNALNTQMARDLIQVLNELETNIDIWSVILTGAGEKAFCVGADLKERKNMDQLQMRQQRELFVKAFTATKQFPKPIIAAVNGYALGGGFEFALCCDMIIAAENAVLGLPEVGLGIIPGGGGTQNLPRWIGSARAKELIFTGRKISAAEAERLGAVSRVVPQEQLLDAAWALVEEINKNAPVAVQQAKKAIDVGLEIGLPAGLILEAETYKVCLTTEDRQEGLRAFNEKRKPVYKGY
ncbi:MAG: enoyl-CoA hydratase/isomerase family protein [Thermoanaerobacteraceae bacterium]|nr:enoyl-CoA hydratase/isomerase family protein [Thermoanaerobacteraceae bacterium]